MPNHKHPKTASGASRRLKLVSLFSLAVIVSLAILVGNFIFKFLDETNFFHISYLEITNRQLLGNVRQEYFYDLVDPKTSIFKVNLAQIKDKIEADFPQVQDVIIARIFPNRLILNLIGYHITAQVFLGKKKYFDVDDHGFILPDAHPKLNPVFPLILGLDEERQLIKPKQRTASGRVLYALSFIKEYKENNWLPDEHLVALDVCDSQSVNLFLDENLEIRILRNELKPKIKILEGLLKEIRLSNPGVKCIDLRFKDVIINPKDDKNIKK